MSIGCDVSCSDNCSTAEDKLSSPCCEMTDWLAEHSDIMDDSGFFEFALAETNKKRRKLADGSAEVSSAKHMRNFKRDLAKKRKTEPDIYKQQKQELNATSGQVECDVKKQQQMIRNRISAQQSRDRKKAQLLNLEQENSELKQKLHAIESERKLLKSTLAKIDRSKLYRVFRGASMTMATFLSLCLLVNSLHDTGEISNQIVKTLGDIDLAIYRDTSGVSLHSKSTEIFQSLISELDLDSTDQSEKGEEATCSETFKTLISNPLNSDWLLAPEIIVPQLPKVKAELPSVTKYLSSITPS
mmetsp:Transcript_15782/g.28832  ORF Transcript_15782/g.28832 Transcript_15782/m.28832 type:complete len:300 (+) Transcript_15782:2105-3004(+)